MPAAARAVAPMLASTASNVPVGEQWIFEPKYDGMRVRAFASHDEVRLVTRNSIDRAGQFPEVVHALKELARKRRRAFVLDGEIVVRRVSSGSASAFQSLQARWHVSDPAAIARYANTSPVDLVAFDVLVDGDERITDQAWQTRRVRLERLLAGPLPTAVRISELLRGDGAALLRRAAQLGWEGIIAKRRDSVYRPGLRSRDWLKLKIVHEQEFVVGGWTEPRRTREHLGALLLGYWKDGALVYAGHTGTGFTRDSLAEIRRRLTRLEQREPPFSTPPRTNQRPHWTKPSTVAVVRFTEWTADGKLRHPVFIGIRDDKTATEVSREPPSMQKRIPRVSRTAKSRARVSAGAAASGQRRGSIVAQLERVEDAGGDGVIVTGTNTQLPVSNLDKIYFPKARLTKGHVMRYYAAVAPLVLPLIADRPLVLKRFPEGVAAGPGESSRASGSFFQQRAPANTPPDVRVDRVHTADGIEPRLVGGDLTTLLYGVQIGAIELNPWHSRIGTLSYADYIVLDLDPGPRAPRALVVHCALWIREVLDEFGFSASVKTSGGRGLHVYVPLPERTTFHAARTAADIIAHYVAARHPNDTTLIRSLKARPPSAVYLDVGQNDRGKSVAAPFSLRAREPGPVSTPLAWDELTETLDPLAFTIDSVLPEAKRRAGIWRSGLRRPIDLASLTRPTTARRAARRSTRANRRTTTRRKAARKSRSAA